MPDSFGARLRQQREERGIALAVIAKQTRIKESLLDALERDDLSQWPTGFYRRAFFRAYACAIHLDVDAAYREFQSVHPEPPAVDVLTAMAAALNRVDGNGRSAALRGAVGSAIGSLARLGRSATPEPTIAPPPPQAFAEAVSVPEAASRACEEPDSTRLETASPQFELQADTVDQMSLAPQPEAPPEPVTTPRDTDRVEGPPTAAPPLAEALPDLLEFARLCTDLARVGSAADAQLLLRDAAHLLDATGLIVWLWVPAMGQLQPALVHGYSPRVVAHLPAVRRDDDNVTAAAFRTAETRVIAECPSGQRALVVPLVNPWGCAGVLAIEFPRGKNISRARVALATIVAAQLTSIAPEVQEREDLPVARLVVGGLAQPV